MGRKRYWNGDDFEDVETVETNGNLTLIEKEDGSLDWVGPAELDQ